MQYVVSDVHGYFRQLVAALRHAELIDADRTWSGGQARLTLLGDYFDRGPDGIAVVDLIRRLQDEADAAGGKVEALIGNHEVLALGMSRFGDELVPSAFGGWGSFAQSWVLNGGQVNDQLRLTPEHIAWLSDLDSITLKGEDLLLHSDTAEYLGWGDTPEKVNDAIRQVLAGDDLVLWWDCWVRLTSRYAFAGFDGEQVATDLLDRLGGKRIVHGHSFISTLNGQEPKQIVAPFTYAGGRVLAIDGGIAGGGPCLIVPLNPQT
jgi:Calcineurin-like phosphoesterase